MKEALESFWSERGITLEVRTTLTPYARSVRYATLQFDVYEQIILPGRLEGGTAGGVAGGISQGISHGIAEGVSRGIVGGIRGALRTQPSWDEPSVDYRSEERRVGKECRRERW